MKIYVRQIVIYFLFFSICAFAQPDSLISNYNTDISHKRPKIGLVLSGGGARGFAHIGTLKMLDSLGIPIDYIAGTSMGGIIGALYAIGYSGLEIEEMAKETDWTQIFTDQPPRDKLPYFEKIESGRYQIKMSWEGYTPVMPTGLSRGQKVFQILSRLTYSYQNVTDFNDLPIPFSCVAIDLVSGEEIVLSSGSLAMALRSTMSIPTVFTPVEWGDSLLIDGAVMNNLPVDVAKNMGADIVIAVNVGTPRKEREELNSILAILEQTVNLASFKREDESVEESDIVITPELEKYSSTDFESEKIDEIIAVGDLAAIGQLDVCINLRDKLGISNKDLSGSNLLKSVNIPRLHGITITGNTTLPFNLIYDNFDLKPGDYCTPDTLEKCINRLKDTHLFKDIRYEIRPVGEGLIRLIINVKEKEKPIIFGVEIKGNKNLSFKFIYEILNVKAGSVFDPDYVDEQITSVYSLGYFQNIYYEIEPLSEGQVRLTFNVTEKPKREIRIGFRFDDNYKLVAAVGFKATNLLINGLRIEDELQFLGLIRLHVKAFYPTRTLDFPIYPFARIAYNDVTMNIYDGDGNIVANYPDRSWQFAGGFGFLVSNFLNAEIEYNYELMNVTPEVALADPSFFPTWKDKLSKIQGRLTIDLLDDPIFPFNGLYVRVDAEKAHKELGSEISYTRFSIEGKYYFTFNEVNTIQLFGFYGLSDRETPVYKLFYRGGPFDFVGLDYHQMVGYEVYIFRADYRLKFNNNFYASIIGSVGENVVNVPIEVPYGLSELLLSYGLSITYNSPVGPLKITYGNGINSAYNIPDNRNYFFFTGGFNF